MTDTKLGGLFFPVETNGKKIAFDSLFIPYIYKEIYFECLYVDILNGKSDMTIIDVGSNCGITVQHFRDYAKKVYAIEPSPEHFEALQMNKEFNKWDNVELFNVAIADKDGEMELTMNDYNRTMNSLNIGKKIEDNKYETNSRVPGIEGFIKAKGYNNRVVVKTVAMDTFFNDNHITKCDFMKFDVEGAEDMILRSEGFKKVKDKVIAIEVEFHYPNWQELVKYMIGLGYEARRYDSSAVVILFTLSPK
jgi:FkbM family methyltransferase